MSGGFGILGMIGTTLSAVSSVGSLIGGFGGGGEATSAPGGYIPSAPPAPPALPAVPAVAVEEPVIDQAAVDAEAIKTKRDTARRNISTLTDKTKGLLAQEQATTTKSTLLGG